MKNNNVKDWFKGKGFYISLVAGAVCVVAITAVCLDSFGVNKIISDSGKNEKRQELAKVEELTPAPSPVSIVEEPAEETSVDKKLNDTSGQNADNKKDEKKETTKTDKKTTKDDNNTKDIKSAVTEKKVAVMEAGEKINSLKFDQEAGILWPVTGDVIMKYSADNTIYFKTLGQYKSNPAIIISAEEGTNVSNAVEGVVTEVGQNEEIGNYVETSIGDDYKIIYGQLDNIQVEKGATIKEGELLGVVAAPTKYYSEEGANLYMKMTCDNEPVDPMIFLR